MAIHSFKLAVKAVVTLSPIAVVVAVVVAVAVGVGVKGGYIDSHRPSPLSSSSPLQLPLAGRVVTLSP